MHTAAMALKTFILLEFSAMSDVFTLKLQEFFGHKFLPHAWMFTGRRFYMPRRGGSRLGSGIIANSQWHDLIWQWVLDSVDIDDHYMIVQETLVWKVEALLTYHPGVRREVRLLSRQAIHIVFDQQCQ